jgi:hypothetical protein
VGVAAGIYGVLSCEVSAVTADGIVREADRGVAGCLRTASS